MGCFLIYYISMRQARETEAPTTPPKSSMTYKGKLTETQKRVLHFQLQHRQEVRQDRIEKRREGYYK